MAKDLTERYRHWEDFSLDLADAFRAQHMGAQQAQEFADSDKFETLRKLPFFEHFSDAELWEVARMSSWRHARQGELLMKEGEAGDFFCILADGQVKVTRRGRLLNVLNPGECFGEMAYLSRNEHRRVADVTVTDEADIIAVPTAMRLPSKLTRCASPLKAPATSIAPVLAPGRPVATASSRLASCVCSAKLEKSKRKFWPSASAPLARIVAPSRVAVASRSVIASSVPAMLPPADAAPILPLANLGRPA